MAGQPVWSVRASLGYPREHLAARVGFLTMVNPAKGARLRRLLDEVEWS